MMVRGRLWGCFMTAMRVLCVLLLTCTSACHPVMGIKCPPCQKIHCSPRQASRLRCRGGVTTGVCGCCPVCAKMEGEKCGGDYAYLGRCDRDLFCVPAIGASSFMSTDPVLQNESFGVCTKTARLGGLGHQADAGFEEFCRPLCTPEFCRRRPSALCSARVTERFMDCQGRCQHTSCRACQFIGTRDCPACAHGDFRCLRNFGKCVQKFTCSVNKNTNFWKKISKAASNLKFVCTVPDCL